MNPTRPPRAAVEPPDLPHPTPWRARMFEVIFGHDTRAGKAFDVALLATILGSVAAVMAESVPRIQATWGRERKIESPWGLLSPKGRRRRGCRSQGGGGGREGNGRRRLRGEETG